MKCVILVAGLDQRLEEELKKDTSSKYADLVNVPKALLPTGNGNVLLDNWWEAIRWAQTRNQFDGIYLVTNAEKFKYYERWATANGFPRENVINDGSTANTGGIGSLADFNLALSCKKLLDSDVMVVAGDMLFDPKRFDIMGVVSFFKAHRDEGDVACYYEMDEDEDESTRGIIEVDSRTKRVTSFVEKPKKSDSRLASIVFYVFRKESIPSLKTFLRDHPKPQERSFGRFMEWYLPRSTVFGMKLPDRFDLIGSVSLAEYKMCTANNENRRKQLGGAGSPTGQIVCRTYARVGVLGNPSDGFFGKTISLSIQNFWAQVSIEESDTILLVRHPLNDPTTFGSLADLHAVSVNEAYLGGLRLMQATCKKFHEFCSTQGIAIARKNFTLKYDTNIPRQVGLAGSSAIVTSTMKCLMRFFNLTNSDIPKDIQPNFVLSVETEELGINAGLQDRVIQVYGGCVYMNFDEELLTKNGVGAYEYVDTTHLPQLWLSYLADPSDSGKIHNNVRKRWDAGDEEVRAGMQQFASIAFEGKKAIEADDIGALADLMDKNFALRRKLYTDAALGDANLKMVGIAKKYNAVGGHLLAATLVDISLQQPWWGSLCSNLCGFLLARKFEESVKDLAASAAVAKVFATAMQIVSDGDRERESTATICLSQLCPCVESSIFFV
eukprot:m.966573 g.966573  ORF g.966573 m.966573 type:complete len:667 (+) comp23912_c0_seq54:101-2101(+)